MSKIYIVVSSTPTLIGKSIRAITNSQYNHVSFSFDSNLKDLISFGRYYYSIPFYGGYIHESIERYTLNGKTSIIKLFELEIEEEKFKAIQNLIYQIENSKEKYTYNYHNALLMPFNMKKEVPESYTCLNFIQNVLELCGFKTNEISSINKLIDFLKKFQIYEGPITKFDLSENKYFLKDFSTREKISLTYKQNLLFVKQMFHAK